jgi:hypothetical protein
MQGDEIQAPGASGGCRHDEALLRTAAESLERTQAEAREGQEASQRAGDAEWSGTAGDAYRARTARIAAELAALTAGLVALGVLLSSLQKEAQDCDAVRAMSSMASPSGIPRLPITSPRGPLIPHPSAGPIIPYESSTVRTPPTGQDVCR